MNTIQLTRFTIGLSWIYHGFFPKLWHIAPTEQAMTASIGLSVEYSDLLTRVAGVGEILFGLIFIVFYRSKTIVWLNIIALVALLGFVMVMKPAVLIGAFNPMTTNIPLIVLSFWLLDKKFS